MGKIKLLEQEKEESEVKFNFLKKKKEETPIGKLKRHRGKSQRRT